MESRAKGAEMRKINYWPDKSTEITVTYDEMRRVIALVDTFFHSPEKLIEDFRGWMEYDKSQGRG